MRASFMAGGLAALAVSACYAPPAYVANPYPPVPLQQAEAIPRPPVSEEPLIWQPGHWDWAGNGYVWTAGQYVPAAGHGTQWYPGYWASQGARWVWVPAHWV